jgi:lysophospholipase L1-like esterase
MKVFMNNTKRVLLIGDSIRLSYEQTVREILQGRAFVSGPAENSQHTVHILLNFWTWIAAYQPDILHINAGLWDARFVVPAKYGNENLIPVEQYGKNVERILRLASEHTNAKIIWATCTPVIDNLVLAAHAKIGLAGRTDNDIPTYNKAAIKAADKIGIEINDLHKVVTDYGKEKLLMNDGTHYNELGVEVLGTAVAEFIGNRL